MQKPSKAYFSNALAIGHQMTQLHLLFLTSMSKAASLHFNNVTCNKHFKNVFIKTDNSSTIECFSIFSKNFMFGNVSSRKLN
jgi:hypothetical protein